MDIRRRSSTDRRSTPSTRRSPRTRSVLLATGLAAVVISPLAVAATGGALREGVRNGTSTRETEIVSSIASSNGLKGGYSTRQSNLSSSGGGAVYGCRSQAGGSAAKPTPQNPCLRANNLSRGLAFEFNATIGDSAGLITAGSGGDTKKPFTTNATGIATGLNADRVDGLNAGQIIAIARTKANLDADTLDGRDSADFLTRFAQISAGGAIGESRGLPAYAVAHIAGSGIYAVAFNGDLTKCAIAATLTGGALGEIVAVPTLASGNTTIAVTTADSTGSAEDRAFHVQANC